MQCISQITGAQCAHGPRPILLMIVRDPSVAVLLRIYPHAMTQILFCLRFVGFVLFLSVVVPKVAAPLLCAVYNFQFMASSLHSKSEWKERERELRWIWISEWTINAWRTHIFEQTSHFVHQHQANAFIFKQAQMISQWLMMQRLSAPNDAHAKLTRKQPHPNTRNVPIA